MWGFLASMNHSIAIEDKDMLYLEINIQNSSVENVIIGELYILWEFEETDIPMLSHEINPITFIYNKLQPSDLKNLASTVWTTFEKVAKGKEKARNLKNIFNEKFITPIISSDIKVDLSSVDQAILELNQITDGLQSITLTNNNLWG